MSDLLLTAKEQYQTLDYLRAQQGLIWIDSIPESVKCDYLLREQVRKCQTHYDEQIKEAVRQERKNLLAIFRKSIPCIPDLHGHGCDGESYGDCGGCKYINEIMADVLSQLKEA